MDNNESMRIVSAVCPNCGAKIIGSNRSPALKCHWCQTMIPANLFNAEVRLPDYILPFTINKDEAIRNLKEYINLKRQFAKDEFINSIDYNNLVPIYLPYMLVDVKAHASFTGMGQRILEKDNGIFGGNNYKSKLGVYDFNREFDLAIDNLLIESSTSGSFNPVDSSSNIISSVSPFDTEKCVKFNANFLNGYNSENRELDIQDMKSALQDIIKDISSSIANSDNDNLYDGGLLLNNPKIDIIGTKWNAAYMPVWLYTYRETVDGKVRTYYIAVNGRTGKTEGSIPVNEKAVNDSARSPIMFVAIALLSIILIASLVLLIKNYTSNSHSPSVAVISILMPFISSTLLIFTSLYFSKYKIKKADIRESVVNETQKIDYVNDTSYKPYNIVSNEQEKDVYVTRHPRLYNKQSNVTYYIKR